MNKINATLLEYNSGVYEGNAYASVVARYNGRLTKFKLDTKKVADLTPMIDSEVELTYEIVPGDRFLATIRVVEVELA